MSNRQQRRQRQRVFIDGDTIHLVRGQGQGVHVDGAMVDRLISGARVDAEPDGHVWALFAMFRCARPDRYTEEEQTMDTENLLQVSGPGCYRCEQMYSPDVAALPCPGDPDAVS